jgi:thiamine-phosphate pyrophosphorylase
LPFDAAGDLTQTMTFLPEVYPITDAGLSGRTHSQLVAEYAAAGAMLIQIREKNAPAADFYREALEAVAIGSRFGAKIIINDRVDIAIAVNAAGVHLGQDDLPPHQARKLLGPDKLIGFSTHNLQQAAEALSLGVDYIAFGPVFPTSTKLNPDPVVGLQQLSEIKSIAGGVPVVAIGGIGRDNIAAVIAAGADSAAVISALYEKPRSAGENYQYLRDCINNAKHF